MANDTNKILEKILAKESQTVKKLCDLITAIGEGGGPGPGGTQYSVTVEQACDNLGGGERVPIEIIKLFENGEFTSIEYRTLDGTPYTIQGELGLCTNEVIIEPPTEYNDVAHMMLDDSSGSMVFPQQTVHSISYKILSGVVNITIGGVTLPYIMGEADEEQATKLINQAYTFTPQPGGKVKIKTIS